MATKTIVIEENKTTGTINIKQKNPRSATSQAVAWTFRIRSEMVKDIKGNFSDKYRRKGGADALMCEDCTSSQPQTQSHCLICPRWEQSRSGLDLEKIDGLVVFFQRILVERLKEDIGS